MISSSSSVYYYNKLNFHIQTNMFKMLTKELCNYILEKIYLKSIDEIPYQYQEMTLEELIKSILDIYSIYDNEYNILISKLEFLFNDIDVNILVKEYIFARLYTLPSSTAYFKMKDIEHLKIKYTGTNDENKIFENISNYNPSIKEYFYIKYINKEEILKYGENGNPNFTKKENSICNYLYRISENEKLTIGTRESNTDTLVDFLLRKLHLDEYPLALRLQPNYKINYGDQVISSNPEFSIEKNRLIMFIDEDKHINNVSKGKKWGEYQIAGEILAAAYTNYNNTKNKKNKEQIIKCMRVIGTCFTFYKAIIPEEYLISLDNGVIINGFNILRYPDNHEDDSYSNLDYMNVKERNKIIELLYKLKYELESNE
jgi:hypothetical protein